MPAPVKHTCPDIDKVIKMIRAIQTTAKYGMKTSDDSSDDYQRYKDIEWDVDDIVGRLEDLRKANAELRAWGEELENELEAAQQQIGEFSTAEPQVT